MIVEPSIALHFGQGFFLLILEVIGHSWAIWPLVDPGWSLYELRPQQWIKLLHRFFLPNLVAKGIFKQFDRWMDLWPSVGSLRKYMLSNPVGLSVSQCQVQLHTSKHDERHSLIYIVHKDLFYFIFNQYRYLYHWNVCINLWSLDRLHSN